MTTRRTVLVGGAILLAVAAPSSSAQEGEGARCGTATAVVDTRSPRKDNIQVLASCPASGAPAAATVWTRATKLSPEARAALAAVSVDLRDARIYEAVLTTAHATNRPTEDRLAALSVLCRTTTPASTRTRSSCVPPLCRMAACNVY
jgi:hypothetical protein